LSCLVWVLIVMQGFDCYAGCVVLFVNVIGCCGNLRYSTCACVRHPGSLGCNEQEGGGGVLCHATVEPVQGTVLVVCCPCRAMRLARNCVVKWRLCWHCFCLWSMCARIGCAGMHAQAWRGCTGGRDCSVVCVAARVVCQSVVHRPLGRLAQLHSGMTTTP
jgi:hypothetical protein